MIFTFLISLIIILLFLIILFFYLLKGFVFKENRAALLVRDMLSAIHYLHTYCSIVHRDLKLENFLFEQPHIDAPLMLIDFGLAKKFEKGERMRQKVINR